MPDAIYVYQSANEYLLNQAVDEQIKKLEVDPFNLIRYDLLETPSAIVLEDLQTIAFFSDLKVIVVSHMESLLQDSNDILQLWAAYMKKPNPDVVLIILLTDMIDRSSILGDAIDKYAYIETIKQPSMESYPQFVKTMFEEAGYDITDAAVEALLSRTNYDLTLLTQEAEKLKIYTIDEKKINEFNVMQLVSRNLEEHIYELTNALLAKQQAKTIDIYHDLLTNNEDPLRILNVIVNKMRELMHVRILLNQGLRQDDIANYFHVSRGRAYYMVKAAKHVQIKNIETQLNKLGELDFNIKSGNIEKKLGVELYLLGV